MTGITSVNTTCGCCRPKGVLILNKGLLGGENANSLTREFHSVKKLDLYFLQISFYIFIMNPSSISKVIQLISAKFLKT